MTGIALADGPLSPEKAFWMRVRAIGNGVYSVDFRTEPGYIVYADRMGFKVDGRDVKVDLPAAQIRFDKTLGKRVSYYEGEFSALAHIKTVGRQLALSVHAQGCAVEWGVCYPPMRRDFIVG